MQPARIPELLAPFLAGSPAQPAAARPQLYQHISTYIDLLLHWNARINLTAIRDPEQIVIRHFGESLFTAKSLFPAPENSGPRTSLGDLGSGAGFPGLPIKLLIPSISLTLIESNHKKATFLKEVCRALALDDVKIETARAEILPPATFDVLTLRAVERLSEILPSAARLLRPSGRLALLVSSAQFAAIRTSLPNFYWSDPSPVPCCESRMLLIGSMEPSPKRTNLITNQHPNQVV